jgi:hypothetical protein
MRLESPIGLKTNYKLVHGFSALPFDLTLVKVKFAA